MLDSDLPTEYKIIPFQFVSYVPHIDNACRRLSTAKAESQVATSTSDRSLGVMADPYGHFTMKENFISGSNLTTSADTEDTHSPLRHHVALQVCHARELILLQNLWTENGRSGTCEDVVSDT